jgi:hypothetical protein
MVQISLPKLTLSSDLEDFRKIQRLRPLSFLRVCFLDLVHTSCKVLSLLSLISSKVSISQALLSFLGNLSNSDLKILEKNYFPPSWHSSVLVLRLLYGVASTLSRILDLCTPCSRFLRKIWILADDCALLAAVTLHYLQRKSYAISSELYESKQTLSTHSLRTVCTPCTAHEEK